MALALRLALVIHTHYVTLYGDSVHYDNSALLLIDKHFFSFWGHGPDAYVTPGYPLFLALCYRIAMLHRASHDFELRFAIFIQALLSAISCGFLYWAARRMLSRGFALFAAFLFAFYLPSIWSITQILTETLYVFLLLLFVWLFTVAMAERTLWWWAASGFAIGLSGLVRPTVFPLVLAALIYLAFRLREGEPLKRLVLEYICYAIGFLVPLVPWWIRNVRLLHHLVLSDTEVGNPLLFGSDPWFKSGPLLGHGLSEVAQKQLAIHRIITGFTHDPLTYLNWYTAGKLSELFGKPWYPPLTHDIPLVGIWLHLHLAWVILGTLGVVVGLFVPHMRFVAWLTVFLVVIQLPFIPVNRYAFPIMPLLFIATALLAQQLWTRWSGSVVEMRPGRSYP